jgi:hypothetical protein
MNKKSTGTIEALVKHITKRPWLLLVVIATVLLAIKLYALSLMPDLPLIGDEKSYFRLSKDYFSTYWEQSDYWAPMQIIFLAVLRILDGSLIVYTARIIQLIVHTLTAAIIFLIGRELKSDKVGLTASIFFLVLPEVVSMAYLLFSETWFMFWFFAGTLMYLRAIESSSYFNIALSGLTFGVATMFRSINLYFLPLLLLYFWLYTRQPKTRKLVLMAILLTTMSVPISIQTVKNYRIFREFLPIDTCGADNVWASHNVFPPPNYDYGVRLEFLEASKKGFPGARPTEKHLSPGSRQVAEIKNALMFITNNPLLTIKRTLKKISGLFYPALFVFRNFEQGRQGGFISTYLNSPACRAVGSISYAIMMMLSVAGLLFCNEIKVRCFTLMLLGYHLGMSGFFFSLSRFRLAFVPLLIVFMAWAIHHRRSIWAERRSWKGALVLLIWVIMLLDWLPYLLNIIWGSTCINFYALQLTFLVFGA